MRIEEPGGPDAVTVNPDRPVYQVNVFRLDQTVGVPDEMRGYHVYEWKLHDADVTEVLDWAKQKADTDLYTVSVASASVDGDSHLLRLYGRDPNEGEPGEGYYTSPSDGMVPDTQWFIEQAKREQGQ